MKKATLLPPPLSLKGGGGGGARALDGTKIRAASEHEPVVVLVCMCVCVHVPTCVLYEALTHALLIHQSCLPGCHTVYFSMPRNHYAACII